VAFAVKPSNHRFAKSRRLDRVGGIVCESSSQYFGSVPKVVAERSLIIAEASSIIEELSLIIGNVPETFAEISLMLAKALALTASCDQRLFEPVPPPIS
jgi:hypothetical protein